ncbi:MAG: ACP S-malonyltransferase [Deltaproteobacteria bacterium]|nr:ACP S-malonyltransferase [Deltaproteobacteria bacterium]
MSPHSQHSRHSEHSAPTPVAVVFPGQGSQKLGMGKDFYEKYPESRRVFEEASDACGLDLADICFGDEASLALTEFQQPAILTVEIAMLEAMKAHHGFHPRLFAGHSLGEYTALVAAGVYSLADAVRIVRLRGKLMQQTVPAGAGAMTAIIHRDLDIAALTRFVARFEVDVANHNALDQAVISGLEQPVAAAVGALREDEAWRKLKTIPLRVSAPFHSRHMWPIQEPLRAALANASAINAWAAISVASNTTGTFHVGSRDELEKALVKQVTSTVRWVQNMRDLLERTEEVVEVGPGRPLRGFFASLGVEISSIRDTASAI